MMLYNNLYTHMFGNIILFFMFLKEVSYSYQACIYLVKNAERKQ